MQEPLKNLQEGYSAKDAALIGRAFSFAREAHKGQKRESGELYMSHPLAVATILRKIGLDAQTIAAALLHDVIEDTPSTLKELSEIFGKTICFLVSALTGLEKIDYRQSSTQSNKQSREFIKNFRKMLFATAKDIRVLIIKLADVLHNMRTIQGLPQERQERYAREVLAVYAPVAARLGIGWLKGELEDRAFAIVRPTEHRELKKRVSHLIQESKQYIENLIPHVEELLARLQIDNFSIDARAKHLYSLWQKLQRYDGDLSRIYDLVALRIIVPTVSDCYETFGMLHAEWTPLPGRVKDYIALPKPNGYRSLHTTVFCNDGKITEFQIRTTEMHHEAEMGVAAHWAYKGDIHIFNQNTGWIKQLREWQESASPDDLIESLKIDFFQDRIFVFTPKGDVINLPKDATPIDFAYAIHSDIGDHVRLAKVNSKPVQLSTPLSNNDMVEIITAKNKKPSRDWLSFAKTSKARAKIRAALRNQ